MRGMALLMTLDLTPDCGDATDSLSLCYHLTCTAAGTVKIANYGLHYATEGGSSVAFPIGDAKCVKTRHVLMGHMLLTFAPL
jgi:hypothetical protein